MLRETNISIQRLRKIIKSLKSLLPQVNHPLVELTFLIEGERILVFNGVVLMSSKSNTNYVRFDVKSLRDEIDRTFPDLYALPDEEDQKQSVA